MCMITDWMYFVCNSRVFAIYRKQEWSELSWQWECCCKCLNTLWVTTYHFPCTSYTNRVPPNYVLLCVCYVFPCSPQTPCVRNKISAPKTEMDVRNRDPPTGVLIPQQSLLCRLGPCSTAKVNKRTVQYVRVCAHACLDRGLDTKQLFRLHEKRSMS